MSLNRKINRLYGQPHSVGNRHSCLTRRTVDIERAGCTVEGMIHQQRFLFSPSSIYFVGPFLNG